MYRLNWMTKECSTKIKFINQEIPVTKYKSNFEKVKDSEIRERINELLKQKEVEGINVWKYPMEQNKQKYILHVSGELLRNWENSI